MEKLKVKHDHKLTDILKVGIFAIFLLLPFFTYAPTALYYGVNEYAVNNTTTQVDIQYKYQSNEVNSTDDLVEGNIYLTNWQDMYPSDFLHENEYLTFQLLGNLSVRDANRDEPLVPTSFTPYTYLKIYGEDTALFITDFNDDYIMSYDNFGDFANDIVIKIIDINIVDTRTSISSIFRYTDYNEIDSVDVQTDIQNTISQQMYNSWQTMWETPMYSWTNNSILKTSLDNFTGVFGVNNQSYITNLITYELIIVAIYIVIDIVLTLFKWLTHLLGER